ncbi:MAG TPA: NAD(P)-dependent glycerol-1-phosphate dehydrogenase [Methanospirillum sp.]|uniref:NAD(P)-dependent glycerol-1-phosphate dehydrogenase n=1 Tax=Methanospirillum sp. TaxID=45200 RepID=UPI002CEA6C91|nr:NAD(P)-dependent glycerol-1-phosphate dehydrogenase [Methanospirillum sp.]HOJ95437.1 NAD(P)-dependent glycerol-1-phosphate dehydrogenase [Methanospirillum sp.]HPP76891.1 NAD(P)-dependent glycerol-1-phosphate dehydrogenase [Methanospirillum sp.]
MSTDPVQVLQPDGFNKSRWTQLPRDVLIGHQAIMQLPDIIADIRPGRSVLIISGGTTREVAGNTVADILKDQYEVRRFVAGKLDTETLEACSQASLPADFLIGVGGGRVIDCAKIVSYNQGKPFISVPTAASHDGIISGRATLPTETGSVSVGAHPPIAVVADTGIISQAPHRLMASGCADVISNYTAILDWELAHRLRGEQISEYAIALSKMTAEILVKDANLIKPGQEEAAWIVVKALVSSGVSMAIAGSSRPASGGEHKFGHALERLMPGAALHGEACGIGSIMTMYLHGGDWRAIRSSLARIGAPTTPRHLNIPDEVVVEALMKARDIRPERFTILDMGLTRESAEHLVHMLYEE